MGASRVMAAAVEELVEAKLVIDIKTAKKKPGGLPRCYGNYILHQGARIACRDAIW
jgi:hypothetical protein